MKHLFALLLVCVCGVAWPQSVALQGMLGNKALLIVNGSLPKTVAPGDTHMGVKVVSTAGDTAVVEIEGRRHTLRVGESPSSVGGTGGAPVRSSRVVLPVGSGGHFVSSGAINGRPVQFMVDTGATAVSMSVGDADRLGLDYKTSGKPVRLGTANGATAGWLIKLSSVRVGDVEVLEVDAIVAPAPMPYVLLGNSFLSRFSMTRDNQQMVLERRY